jgi:hypothetical protein
MYCTTRYWHICLMFHRQYMEKYQKYVPVCSCTVHDKASVICASIWLYSTRWIINNMSQYLVVQYMEKDQKYVPESSCTITYETSYKPITNSDVSPCTGTYFWCFIVYCTTKYWHIFLIFHHVLHNLILTHISDDSSCTVQLDTGTYFSSR